MVDRIRYPTVSYLPFYYVFFQFLLLTIFNLQANILTTKDILSNLGVSQVWEYALRRQYIGALNVSNFFLKIQLACQLSLLTSSKLNWRMKRVNKFPKTQLAREILYTYNTLSIQGHSRIAPWSLISSRVQSKAQCDTQTDWPTNYKLTQLTSCILDLVGRGCVLLSLLLGALCLYIVTHVLSY